jgi:hypothetical protein
MQQKVMPWDVDPALTEDRLAYLAELLPDVRKGAIASQEPDKGDGKWGLGCRFYERVLAKLIRASASKEAPWLTALRPNGNPLELYLAIDGCPIHYFRGDPDSPAQHHVIRAQEQIQFWPDPPNDSGWFWLMVVESASDQDGTRVLFEQVNDSGQVRYQYVAARAKAEVPSIAKQGKEIPQPEIGGPPSKKKKGSDGGGEAS